MPDTAGPVRSLFPMLSTENLDHALRFWRDLLGSTQSYRFPGEGPLVFVALRMGSSTIGIAAMTGAAPLHGQALRLVKGHRIELCVYVGEVLPGVGRRSGSVRHWVRAAVPAPSRRPSGYHHLITGAPMTDTPSSTHRHRPAAGRIIRIGLAAAAISAAVNSILYLIAAAIGWFPRDVLTPAGQAITIGPVVIVSAAGALGAAVVLLLLSRFLERPLGAFLVISAVVLAVLSIAPFGIEGAPPQMVATLEVMHLVVAVTAVGLLLRTARTG